MPKQRTPTESSTDRTVSPAQLEALIKEHSRKSADIQSIAGELGERVKNAVDNGHLHRKAFRLMLALYKLDELKRADFIRQIELYVEICRERGLFGAEHAGDLADMADEQSEADADDEVAEAAGKARGAVSLGEAAQAVGDGLTDAARAVQAGIGEIKPRRARAAPRKGMEGAEASGGTRVN